MMNAAERNLIEVAKAWAKDRNTMRFAIVGKDAELLAAVNNLEEQDKLYRAALVEELNIDLF